MLYNVYIFKEDMFNGEIYAEGIYNSVTNTLLVKKGSKRKFIYTNHFEKNKYYALMCELVDKKVIDSDEFIKDYEFSSPSSASSVILGGSTNGRIEWKSKDGKTIKDLMIR